MWEFCSSFDVHGHFSLIVMCEAGSYLPVAGVSTLVVVVILHSRCDIWDGGSLVAVMCSSLIAPGDQLSSCCMYSALWFWWLGPKL